MKLRQNQDMDQKPKNQAGAGRIVTTLIAALVVVSACGGGANSSAASECRGLASDRFSNSDTQYTEITHTDGDLIKGRVMQLRGGEETPHHYWECSYESGSPVITFNSPAD